VPAITAPLLRAEAGKKVKVANSREIKRCLESVDHRSPVRPADCCWLC
jgi:hypothetical protein